MHTIITTLNGLTSFLDNMNATQWALVVGLISPVVHFVLDRYKSFSTTHNWILSFAIPLLGAIIVALGTSTQVNHLLPVFAVVYTAGQSFYFAAVRWWNKYLELTAAQSSAAGFEQA
jgi:hypothetical protein